MMNERMGHRSHSVWPRRFVILGASVVGVLILGAVVVVGLAMMPLSQHEKVHRALDLARLADPPTSATSVRADGFSNLFAMGYFLRFQAPAADIEIFIRQSPGLSGLSPEVFTPEHMNLPHSRDNVGGSQHRRYWLDSTYPWFNPTIRNRGRRYEIPQDADACWGEVIIDDETNTVFVRSSRS